MDLSLIMFIFLCIMLMFLSHTFGIQFWCAFESNRLRI